MRKTRSREPRHSRDASVTSLTSIAVKTFSIRLGSRRNQRPDHQNTRSITTVSATIEMMRIGHITGPPWRKLSIRKLPVITRGPHTPLLSPAAGLPLGLAAAGGAPGAGAPAAGDAATGVIPVVGGGTGTLGGAPAAWGGALAGAFGGGGGGARADATSGMRLKRRE